MAERKPISKKLRFEVFKRDSFTCQYCGRMAPDVVLEVDHIIPVKEGGKNDILNLVTACKDCNSGKGARKLNENSELRIQQQQLKEINEKREQLKLMVQWKKELIEIENSNIQLIDDLFDEITECRLTESGKYDMKCLIKKYGIDEVIEAMEISARQYFKPSSYNPSKMLSYIPRICAVRKAQQKNPNIKNVNYVIKVIKNRFRFSESCLQKLKVFLNKKSTLEDFENLKNIAFNAKSEDEILEEIFDYFEVQEWE